MGPYCNFCNQRCFMHMPEYTPDHILEAYRMPGGGIPIIATCQYGQAYERKRFGYCLDDIRAFENARVVAAADQHAAGNPMENEDTLSAMERYGGSFTSALAVAWRHADQFNRARLRRAFPDLLEQYDQMAQKAQQKLKDELGW